MELIQDGIKFNNMEELQKQLKELILQKEQAIILVYKIEGAIEITQKQIDKIKEKKDE